MSSKEPKSLSTILDLRDKLSPLLPIFEGRIIAVSEMEVNRSNVPTLPIGMIALQDINYVHYKKTNKPTEIQETIVMEFWYKSNKVVGANKSETPFWAFYDYDPLQQQIVDFILGYESPRGYPIQLMRMNLESDELAVMVSFVLRHDYDFCKSEQEPTAILELGKTMNFRMPIPVDCAPCEPEASDSENCVG